jgi:hypothetical protein
MKKVKFLISIGVVMVAAAVSFSFSGNDKIVIYHMQGNGSWTVLTVGEGSREGHAAHGDRWFGTLCPLSGPRDCSQ